MAEAKTEEKKKEKKETIDRPAPASPRPRGVKDRAPRR
jgi:hypothetical protein